MEDDQKYYEQNSIKEMLYRHHYRKYTSSINAARDMGLLQDPFSKALLIAIAMENETYDKSKILPELLKHKRAKSAFMEERSALLKERKKAKKLLKEKEELLPFYPALVEKGFDTKQSWKFLIDEHSLLSKIFKNEQSLVKSFRNLVIDNLFLNDVSL